MVKSRDPVEGGTGEYCKSLTSDPRSVESSMSLSGCRMQRFIPPTPLQCRGGIDAGNHSPPYPFASTWGNSPSLVYYWNVTHLFLRHRWANLEGFEEGLPKCEQKSKMNKYIYLSCAGIKVSCCCVLPSYRRHWETAENC